MNSKLIIIVISGFIAIGSMFLFAGQPEQQTANIIEAVATPNPIRFDFGFSKRSNLEKTFLAPTPVVTVNPHLETPFPSSSPASMTISPSTTPTTLIPTPHQTSTPMPSGDSQQTLPSPSTTPPQSTKININTANQPELEKITGVGPTIAQRIIDYRQINGLFQKVEDIKNVKGIGDKNFEKMKSEITI